MTGSAPTKFSYSVSTSGNTVVVGAPYHEANSEPYSGAVYVFQVPAAGVGERDPDLPNLPIQLGGKVELGYLGRDIE